VRADQATDLTAGRRDRWVRLETRTAVTSPAGFPVETWSLVAEVWMSRRDRTGDAVDAHGQVVATQRVEWVAAYRADLDPETSSVPPTWRLVDHGRVYDVLHAYVLDRRVGLVFVTDARTQALEPGSPA
jgi:head-tail adaptor